MSVQWTDSQQDAISARRGTVLVAAAAGSGKTAVLVQRAIERLTDPVSPTPADKMLIVTFTRAAAAEMRARLERRLYEMIRENPGNHVLKRQSILLSQATIGTVDSFCADMVREHFHQLAVAPDFKILSDKQKEDMTKEALDAVLNQAFEEGVLDQLADAFSTERDDRKLSAMILQLYEYMQSHPFPEKWLKEKVAMYREDKKIQETLWGQAILSYGQETAVYCKSVAESGLRYLEEQADAQMEKAFGAVLKSDRDLCDALLEVFREKDWDKAVSMLSGGLTFARRGALRGEYDQRMKTRLELIRDECKTCLPSLEKLFAANEKDSREEMERTAPLVELLGEITLRFSEKYKEKKQAGGFLDYSDLEHLTIALFLDDEGNPTAVAKDISHRFDEIMIDEYQDINEVQNSLFYAISKDGSNLFMVGDVKQSIYGFRQAMPEIFLESRERFPKYDRTKDAYPASIVLDRNFRSRKEVTSSVNYVFSGIMSKQAGDIDYIGEELLAYGADYRDKPGCETELVFLERDTQYPAEEAESRWIAEKIKEMMTQGFTVTQKGEERPLQYGDICILLRSANKYAFRYAQQLRKLGVPARAAVSGGFFSASEINCMVSFLQVVDNPNQDIPLLAVLMSPIYGFSADTLAELRSDAKSRKESLYLSLLRKGEEQLQCRQVLEEISAFRAVAATMAADDFLTYLYEKTGYTEMVLGAPEGETRLANLHMLQKYAREYESSGYHGVSGFVRFLDRLRRSNADLEAADAPTTEENAVQLMSIHKSKGLEFPVCMVAGCGRNFSGDRAEVLLHPQLGLGVRLKHPDLPARYSTTVREAIALETARSEASEELRVLYVALTRAKEKLILITSGNGLEKSMVKLSFQISPEGISPYGVRSCRNAGQWLMLCALSHPDGAALREMLDLRELPVRGEGAPAWKISFRQVSPQEEPVPDTQGQQAPVDLALLGRMKTRVLFRYPYALETTIPNKVAASKLTAAEKGEDILLSRPGWMGSKEMTPAQRGTALHDFMQYADFAAAALDPQQELDRLCEMGFLTAEQGKAVELSRVKKFFASPLGKQVLQADRVEKERRFTVEIPGSLAGVQENTEEKVILQGAVDCLFYTGNTVSIVDFKTDKVDSPEVLWQRYETQLRLYGYAMEQVTGCSVKELVLYSTWLNQESRKKYEKQD